LPASFSNLDPATRRRDEPWRALSSDLEIAWRGGATGIGGAAILRARHLVEFALLGDATGDPHLALAAAAAATGLVDTHAMRLRELQQAHRLVGLDGLGALGEGDVVARPGEFASPILASAIRILRWTCDAALQPGMMFIPVAR